MWKKKIFKKSNSIIPGNLQVEYNKIKNPNELFLFLGKTNNVINDNFYIIFEMLINKFDKDNQTVIRQSAINYMDNMLDAMLPASPLHRALSSFYQLIFYPLFVKSYRTPKKLSDFNINAEFIRNIMLTNMYNLRTNEDDYGSDDDSTFKLFYFKFNKNLKLVEFILYKSNGVKQVYDKNYKLKSIIMADNEEIKIPKKILLEKPNGNKRVSRKSKSNSSI